MQGNEISTEYLDGSTGEESPMCSSKQACRDMMQTADGLFVWGLMGQANTPQMTDKVEAT